MKTPEKQPSPNEPQSVTDQVKHAAAKEEWMPLHDELRLVMERARDGEFADKEEYQAALMAAFTRFVE